MQRALSDWAFHLVVAAVTLVLLAVGLLGLAFARAFPSQPPSGLPFRQWRSSEIIEVFHDAGLYAEVVRGTTKDERDGLSTWMVVQATPFRLSPREQERGLLLVFNDPADLERMRAYYVGLGKSLPQYKSWVFVQGNVLLQINGEVPEAKAKEYAAVLDALGGW